MHLSIAGRSISFITDNCRLCRDPIIASGASLVAQIVKNLPAGQETWVQSLSQEDPLEKRMATHSSILAWRIPWTEEHGGVQSMELQRVRQDWVTNNFIYHSIRSFIIAEEFSALETFKYKNLNATHRVSWKVQPLMDKLIGTADIFRSSSGIWQSSELNIINAWSPITILAKY